jgi:hypothetical protein
VQRDELIVLEGRAWIVGGDTSWFREAKRLWQKTQDRFHVMLGRLQARSIRATLIACDERLRMLKD